MKVLNSQRHRIQKFMLACLFTVGCGHAQTESERLAELQGIYKQEIGKAAESVDKQYESSLVKLQQLYISQNKLEEALLVKEEIRKVQSREALKESLVRTMEEVPVTSGEKPGKTAVTERLLPEEEFSGWKGDYTEIKEGNDIIFQLAGKESSSAIITRPLENLKEKFPNGLRIRFQYKSDGFQGTGVELRAEFPSLRGIFTFRNPTLTFDGKWNEYIWPFSDTKGQDMMNFQIHLKNGTGTVSFKNIEFLAN